MSLNGIKNDQELVNAYNNYKASVDTYKNSPTTLKRSVKDAIEALKANELYESTATQAEKDEIENMLTEVTE
tara:strand:- start:1284 stop:1499 length:216 start_codon:yes stop_codon:yes gene_type:complete